MARGSSSSSSSMAPGSRHHRPFRKTVCRHWLRGMCMKGDECSYIHQDDKSKMPVCRFFLTTGTCSLPNCPFKHLQPEERKECNMYVARPQPGSSEILALGPALGVQEVLCCFAVSRYELSVVRKMQVMMRVGGR